jgi:hypothetical protein
VCSSVLQPINATHTCYPRLSTPTTILGPDKASV